MWQSAQEWEPVALQGGAQFRVNVTAIMRTVNDCSRHYAHDASLTLNVVDGAINQEASSGPASMTQIDPQFTTASFVVGSSASGTVDMFLAFYRHYSSGAYGNPESTEAVFRISGSGIAKIRDQHDDGCDSNPPTYATYFDVTPYGASATFVVTGKF